jgi:hypothetical protein
MEIREHLNRQRVKHIVSSYQLNGNETKKFDDYLEDLLQAYPSPLIELALVETLVDSWLSIPLPRGSQFLTQTHDKLKAWVNQLMISTLTPEQFQLISGLDPNPVFGGAGITLIQPTGHPS